MAATASVHFHCQVISRASGRSAIAAAAYRLGARLVDARTDEVFDYRRKGGVVHSETLVPKNAPESYKDAGTLWNAVEAAEKRADAQLAREFDFALPRELTPEQNKELARDYIQREFVDRGMCATWAYHDPDGKNHNPHVHVMCTMRGVRDDGSFDPKVWTKYLCRNVEIGKQSSFTSIVYSVIKDSGWEKVYNYKGGLQLTPTEAREQGLHPTQDRTRKQPIQHDEKANDWDTKERMEAWRSAWSDALNVHVARAGVDKLYDHRSFERRGIDRIPQVHMGPEAFNMEHPKNPNREPVETVRGEQNRQIDTLNLILGRRDMPQSVRDEAAEVGYEIRVGHFEDAHEVREHARPLVERVENMIRAAALAAREAAERARQRAAEHIRSAADKVLSNPICRTVVGFIRDMRERKGVEVSRCFHDFEYRYDGVALRGEQLGERYTRRSLERELERRNQPRRRTGRARDFVRDILERDAREREREEYRYETYQPETYQPETYQPEEHYGWENEYEEEYRYEERYDWELDYGEHQYEVYQYDDIDAQMEQAEKDRQAGRGIMAMGRNSEEMVEDRARYGTQEQSRSKGKGHGHDAL